MQTIEQKKKLIEMWFSRIYDYINVIEYNIRYMDTKSFDYQKAIKDIEYQFENIKIIKKVLTGDAYLQGFNHKLIQQ